MKCKKSLVARHYQLKLDTHQRPRILNALDSETTISAGGCGRATQTRELLFPQCSQWKNEQQEL